MTDKGKSSQQKVDSIKSKVKTRTNNDGLSSHKAGPTKVIASPNVSDTVLPRSQSKHNVATSHTNSSVDKPKNLANNDKGQENCDISDQVWPERKKLPPLPKGEITQEVGEAYCKQICQLYPEVFDGQKDF